MLMLNIECKNNSTSNFRIKLFTAYSHYGIHSCGNRSRNNTCKKADDETNHNGPDHIFCRNKDREMKNAGEYLSKAKYQDKANQSTNDTEKGRFEQKLN